MILNNLWQRPTKFHCVSVETLNSMTNVVNITETIVLFFVLMIHLFISENVQNKWLKFLLVLSGFLILIVFLINYYSSNEKLIKILKNILIVLLIQTSMVFVYLIFLPLAIQHQELNVNQLKEQVITQAQMAIVNSSGDKYTEDLKQSEDLIKQIDQDIQEINTNQQDGKTQISKNTTDRISNSVKVLDDLIEKLNSNNYDEYSDFFNKFSDFENNINFQTLLNADLSDVENIEPPNFQLDALWFSLVNPTEHLTVDGFRLKSTHSFILSALDGDDQICFILPCYNQESDFLNMLMANTMAKTHTKNTVSKSSLDNLVASVSNQSYGNVVIFDNPTIKIVNNLGAMLSVYKKNPNTLLFRRLYNLGSLSYMTIESDVTSALTATPNVYTQNPIPVVNTVIMFNNNACGLVSPTPELYNCNVQFDIDGDDYVELIQYNSQIVLNNNKVMVLMLIKVTDTNNIVTSYFVYKNEDEKILLSDEDNFSTIEDLLAPTLIPDQP